MKTTATMAKMLKSQPTLVTTHSSALSDALVRPSVSLTPHAMKATMTTAVTPKTTLSVP